MLEMQNLRREMELECLNSYEFPCLCVRCIFLKMCSPFDIDLLNRLCICLIDQFEFIIFIIFFYNINNLNEIIKI